MSLKRALGWAAIAGAARREGHFVLRDPTGRYSWETMKMKNVLRASAALCATTAIGAAALAPAPAVAQTANLVWSQVYSVTPQCRDFPDYPVVGRVSGYVLDNRNRRVSWVGCFPNARECEAWRRYARGRVFPPIRHNVCEARF
ncbi:MAG: hypothetical protein AcusKO_32560 [Acuticoccus sp.]